MLSREEDTDRTAKLFANIIASVVEVKPVEVNPADDPEARSH